MSVLPEGYFWRIKTPGEIDWFPIVTAEIRKRRRVGSRKVASGHVRVTPGYSVARHITQAKGRALGEWRRERQETALREELKRHAGDH